MFFSLKPGNYNYWPLAKWRV